MTVYGLAQGLRRDYKNVHGDVKVLEELDLIGRAEDGKVEVAWDEIEAHIRLATILGEKCGLGPTVRFARLRDRGTANGRQWDRE